MRLTDVYLMYAEALHVAKGAQASSNGFSLTAEEAVNILRNRSGVPNVHPAIVAEKIYSLALSSSPGKVLRGVSHSTDL